MAEVQQQPYKEPSLLNILFGPELGENARTDYDDVDDYKNYTEKPPLDRTGAAMTDYAKWQRKVKVKWVNPDTLTESADRHRARDDRSARAGPPRRRDVAVRPARGARGAGRLRRPPAPRRWRTWRWSCRSPARRRGTS